MSLILLDNSENGLYQVDRSLRKAGLHQPVSILGSVCNANTIDHAVTEHQPEIIFHAAALKHVPLMEENPFAAYVGILPAFSSLEEINAWIRDLRDDDLPAMKPGHEDEK